MSITTAGLEQIGVEADYARIRSSKTVTPSGLIECTDDDAD